MSLALLKTHLDQGLVDPTEGLYKACCERNSFEHIKLLVEAQADVNKVIYDRSPILELSDDKRALGALQYLIAHKADVNYMTKWGMTPLFRATVYENPDGARLLLQNGAKESINRSSVYNTTPFNMIAGNFSVDKLPLYKLLLDAGAKRTVKCPVDIHTLINRFNQFKRMSVTLIGVLKTRYKIRGAPTDMSGKVPKDLVRLLGWYLWERRYDGEQ